MNLKIKDFLFLILIFYLTISGNSLITKTKNLAINNDIQIENYNIKCDNGEKNYNIGILILKDELFEFNTNEYSSNIYNHIINFNDLNNLILLVASIKTQEIAFVHDKKLNKYLDKTKKKIYFEYLKTSIKK